MRFGHSVHFSLAGPSASGVAAPPAVYPGCMWGGAGFRIRVFLSPVPPRLIKNSYLFLQ